MTNLNKRKLKTENIKMGFNIIISYMQKATIKELLTMRAILNNIIKKKKEFKKVKIIN